MRRRHFIKLTSTASALSLLPTEVSALYKSVGMSGCPDVSSKKIVLIQLSGGNDGLNTVVPINQYDTYANLRPNIKLSNAGAS
ncbi:MAG: twin-arginine translocation pathway signal, partial [Flavobacterium sp.]